MGGAIFADPNATVSQLFSGAQHFVNVVSQDADKTLGAWAVNFRMPSPLPPAPVTFDIATQDNTATVADNDYVARSLTTQMIAAGQQTYHFDVIVNGDTAASIAGALAAL